MYFVYIIKSLLNEQYYIGSSNNPDMRLIRHNSGSVKSTKYKRPWKLVFKQGFDTNKKARLVESKLKRYKNKNILNRIIMDGKIGE